MGAGYVVTGLAVNCACGSSLLEVWDSITEGKTGISEIEKFDTEKCYSHLAAVNKAYQLKNRKNEKYMDDVSKLCIDTVYSALEDAGLLSLSEKELERTAVVIGSCTGGAISSEQYHRTLAEGNKAEATDILKIPIAAISSNVAYSIGAKGASINIANACAAGTISIAYAVQLIQQGEADIVIAGGVDTFSKLPFSGFHALHALDENACSPFSKSQGITLGEGAGIVIVESEEHARQRKGKQYCFVSGSGISADAYHITAPRPDGEGQMQAIKMALKNASLNPSDIQYINAHGTGTPLNDQAETLSINEIFHDNAKLYVSSTKSMMGHCLGAAGAIEAVISIKALTEGVIPSTIGDDEDDTTQAESGICFVKNKSLKADVDYVMSNSFAFGGNNASIIFGKTENDVETGITKDRVMITSLGIYNATGENVEDYITNYETWSKKGDFIESNVLGKSHSNYVIKADKHIPRPEDIESSFYRKIDRVGHLVLRSGKECMERSGVEKDNYQDVGLIVGTSDGPVTEIYNFQKGIIKKGINAGSAFIFPNTVYNAAGGYVSIAIGLKGYNATITNGYASGLSSIAYCYDLIKCQQTDCVVAAGADEYTDVVHHLYGELKALTKEEATEPYQCKKNQFVLSEGAVSVMLESESAVKARNGKCYAEVKSCEMTNEPVRFGRVDCEGEGLGRAISRVLKKANIELAQIDAIIGFGNGAKTFDMLELNTYRKLFGEQLSQIPIYNVKERCGEGRAAASALQVAHGALLLDGKFSGEQDVFIVGEDGVKRAKSDPSQYKNILVTSASAGGAYCAAVLGKC